MNHLSAAPLVWIGASKTHGMPSIAHGFVTTGMSGALFTSLPTNTRDVVPDDSPASPRRLIPVACMDAMASLHPATTGIPAISPVSLAASSVTNPMISSTNFSGGSISLRSTPMTSPISSDHCIVPISRHCVLDAWSISVVITSVNL